MAATLEETFAKSVSAVNAELKRLRAVEKKYNALVAAVGNSAKPAAKPKAKPKKKA